MLPFLKKKEGSATGLLIKSRAPDSPQSEPNEDDPSAAHEACGQAMLSAIAAGDAAGLASAIKDLMELGDADESNDSPSPHTYDAQNAEAASNE